MELANDLAYLQVLHMQQIIYLYPCLNKPSISVYRKSGYLMLLF
jgi:hypothetical protein